MAVNEGGGTHINIAGTTTYLLGIGEKGRLEVKLSVKGTSAHASTPWLGKNASFKVAKVLSALEAYRASRDTSADIFKYLPTLAVEHKITHYCKIPTQSANKYLTVKWQPIPLTHSKVFFGPSHHN